jgi:S1-C subfamily serine protease
VRLYEQDGSAWEESAVLLRYDPRLDVALLELETNRALERGVRLASRARLAGLRTFDPVYAVGCPLGNNPIPTSGAIADRNHAVDGGRYWMVSAPTYIGNSGGGIFDARSHELIGLFSKIYTHGSLRPTVVPHMGLATPLDEIYDWLESEGLARGTLPETCASRAVDTLAVQAGVSPAADELGDDEP